MNHRASPAPRAVTRGESIHPPKTFDGVKTSIDWVHATWHLKSGDIGGSYTDPQMVRDSIFDDVERFKFEDGKGIFGFSRSCAVAVALHRLYGYQAELRHLSQANPSIVRVMIGDARGHDGWKDTRR